MKGILDWQSKEVVNIFDETSLWSAPFGRLLLANIPMKKKATVLDIGFGTGFPLIELSQRFGRSSTIYGIDIWDEAILRTEEKIRVLGIQNIKILKQSAEKIPLADDSVDLICSNLGVNNFEHKLAVLQECHRVLKHDGSICITTNPIGTFEALYSLFITAAEFLGLKDAIKNIEANRNHRDHFENIKTYMADEGFILHDKKTDEDVIRFVDALSVFNHSLIRFGFLASWKTFIAEEMQATFFKKVIALIQREIKTQGEFSLKIPILYLAFQKS